MVDALFCLLFSPVVTVKADRKELYFSRIICDDTVLRLSHILTHQDLQIVQKVRTMMNESLCNEDLLRQAHLSQVDFYVRKLFSFNRLPVDVFEKLMALREEDGELNQTEETKDDLNKFLDGESNFFLQEPNPIDLQIKEGEGYEEVETIQKKRDPNSIDDDAQDKLEQADPDRAQRMLDELYSNRKLTEAEMRQRQDRYERECAMGYFLQPITIQKLKKKIYFYDDLVR